MQFSPFPKTKYVLLFYSTFCAAGWTILACVEAAYLKRLEEKEEVLWSNFQLHYRLGVDTAQFRLALSKMAKRITRHLRRLDYFRQCAKMHKQNAA